MCAAATCYVLLAILDTHSVNKLRPITEDFGCVPLPIQLTNLLLKILDILFFYLRIYKTHAVLL